MVRIIFRRISDLRLILQSLNAYWTSLTRDGTNKPPRRFIETAVLLTATLISIDGVAQPSAKKVNVASFINGAYPYTPSDAPHNIHDPIDLHLHINAISYQGRFSNDLYIADGSKQKSLFYALAAPATIDAFRIRGVKRGDNSMPRQFTFSVSQSPNQNFQTVATFNTPDSFIDGKDTFYDFSIATEQKITARYLRITVSGFQHNAFWNFDLSADGRFKESVHSQTDFSGIYAIWHWQSIVSMSDLDMVNNQKGTEYGSYLILHQKGMQINGCYVHGRMQTRQDGSSHFEVISEVIGDLTGSVKNNIFRFTRMPTTHNDRRQGAMALAPTGEGIVTGQQNGYFLVMRNSESENAPIKEIMEEGFQSFAASIYRVTHTTSTCEIKGKVRFDSMFFNFDSDKLTSETITALDKVVEAAKAYPEWKFEVIGYTDSIGSAEYNFNLSKQRAASAMRYLVAKGIDAKRLQAKGYGATEFSEAHTNTPHITNRRVAIIQQ